ncbi:sensor histidine kinase [Roseobacter sp. GAI101]|uniref:sensor histidine kinase n=1 Tax=Roseobacter sp. (strain GAI101) TaxID=391589 RepID=UPI00032402F3|nr:ATP-binding protein [Roseobacter sp. GAI101]
MVNNFRENVATKAFILLTVLILGSVTGVGITIFMLDRDNHLSTVRRDVEQALYAATEQIQLRFFETVLVAKNVESILMQSGGVVETQIARLVGEFQRHNPAVLAVALAPKLQVTHSFPQNANNKTIGLKYWEVPAQMASIAQAYRRQSPVVDGPVALVQGGKGYILRYPVFLPNADLNLDQFWGVISIVIKADSLLVSEEHNLGDEDSYIFSLTELQTSGLIAASGKDRTALLSTDPVVTEFSMFGNKWQASASPKGGWPKYSPQSPYLIGFAVFSKLILIGGLLAYRRLAKKKENSHALLAEAVGCIDEGFIAFDDRERLMIVNDKYLAYHSEIADRIVPGMTMEEMLRLSRSHQNGPEELEKREAWIAERLRCFRNPGEPFLHSIGDDFWLKVTEAKTPHGYTVGVWTDVSAEKRAQQAAETADWEKTEFLNNVSHELRTPLTVIFGRATFIKNCEKLPQFKRIQAALDAEGNNSGDLTDAINDSRKFVSEQGVGIAESAKHMIRLVDDLLDWTKVARGTLELDVSTLRVDEVAETVVQDLQSDAAKKGLSLSYSGEGIVEAQADKIRLRQILYNFVNNAIKFTDAGSICLSVRKEVGKVVFSVTDTGRGISEENREKVFQRFHQVDGSMIRDNGGLGLGLAISKQLAELHDGYLTLESTLGQGSTFSLILPRAETAAEGARRTG